LLEVAPDHAPAHNSLPAALRERGELDQAIAHYRRSLELRPSGLVAYNLGNALQQAGRTDEARLMFEKMLGYANHLGLYAEEIGPSGESLGNFPQAFTHLALISAAFNLDKALGTSGA